MSIAFSEETMKEFQELLKKYPEKDAVLLPSLRLAEKDFGNISNEVMEYIAGLLGIPPAKVLGVFTFYTHYKREGTGKYLIQVCSTLPCALRKSKEVYQHIESKLGITEGQTTSDGKFTLKKVECLGSCGTAPVVQINEDYYENLTVSEIDRILDGLK